MQNNQAAMPDAVMLEWYRFTSLTAARSAYPKTPCVYVQTDASGCPLRVGMASGGLGVRYRGGTGYALDAAMHGSGNLVFVAAVAKELCELVEVELIWQGRSRLDYNKQGKTQLPSRRFAFTHKGVPPRLDQFEIWPPHEVSTETSVDHLASPTDARADSGPGQECMAITADHRRWATNRQRVYGKTRDYYLGLIRGQEGRCAFSHVPLRFDATAGTPVAGGIGCHPLYAALDHRAPGSNAGGHHIVSFALNDLKGHLPLACFQALLQTQAWQDLMTEWRRQAAEDPEGREGFYTLLREAST